MGATLDALHKLQSIENQIRSIRERFESKQRAQRAHQKRMQNQQKKINDLLAQIQQAQNQADKFELERKEHEEHINRLRETLNQAKTNKEYAAVLTELNTQKADSLKVEDATLAALSKIDELKEGGKKERETLAKQEERATELQGDADALQEKYGEQLENLENERKEAAEQIPPSVLMAFERACDRHDGEAMALIQKTHPKRAEYVCSGCNMSVTLETINALQSRDDIQYCQHCQRILYLEVPAGVPSRS